MTTKVDTRQAIRTRYHGPTNRRSSRISVICWGYSGGDRKRMYMSYDHVLGLAENHAKAAQMWLAKNNPNTVVNGKGLSFEGDYFWTWDHGETN